MQFYRVGSQSPGQCREGNNLLGRKQEDLRFGERDGIKPGFGIDGIYRADQPRCAAVNYKVRPLRPWAILRARASVLAGVSE